MRLSFTSVLITLGLASTAAADRLTIHHNCALFTSCRTTAIYYTDFASYSVDGGNGCKGTQVPGMVDFCIDSDKYRAHVQFSHQSHKRCLYADEPDYPDCGQYNQCWTLYMEEGPCYWRLPSDDSYPEIGDEKIETLSATVPSAEWTVAPTLPESSQPAEPAEPVEQA